MVLFDTIMKSNYIYKKIDIARKVTLPEYYFTKLLILFDSNDEIRLYDIENEFFNFLIDILFPCISEDEIRNAVSCNDEYKSFVESSYAKDLPKDVLVRFNKHIKNDSFFQPNNIQDRIRNILSEENQATINNSKSVIYDEQIKTICVNLRESVRWGNEARLLDINVASHSLTTSFMMYYLLADNGLYSNEKLSIKLFFKAFLHDVNEIFVGDIISSVKHLSTNTEMYWRKIDKQSITNSKFINTDLTHKMNYYVNTCTKDINNICKLVDYINAFYECKLYLNRNFNCKNPKELREEIFSFYQKEELNQYISEKTIIKTLEEGVL